MNQIAIEERYSSKGLNLLLDELYSYMPEETYKTFVNRLDSYLNSNYYESKNLRLREIKQHSIDDIIYYVFVSVFTRGETTLQNTSTALGLYFHNDKLEAFKSGCEILSLLDGYLYSITRKNRETFMINPLRLPKYILDEILLYRYLPPMIEKPLDWSNTFDGGYISTRHCAILGDRENKENKDVNLSILNKLQKVKYSLTNLKAKDEEKELSDKSFYNFREELKDTLKNKPLYFVWQYDKRGRVYSHGYHLNIQSNEYGKSLVEFYDKEHLTDRGKYWLKISIANHYGLDKETFKSRERWVDSNIKRLLLVPETYISKAEEPSMFRKAIEAYKQGVMGNKPIGYIAQFDATTSGVQIASALMKDRDGLKYSNLIGSKTRYDFYTMVAKEIIKLVPNSTLFKDMNFKEIRKLIKKPIMTYYYNSLANPKSILGDDTDELKAFYKTLNTLAKGANEFMELGNEIWSDELDYNSWYLPDGHRSYCPVMELIKKRVSIDELKGQVTYVYNQQQPSKNKFRSLVPNLIHSYDGYVLRNVIARADFDIAPIHDCFGVHPNNVDKLRELYRNSIANIVENIDCIALNGGRVLRLPNTNISLASEIRANEKGYYLC